MQDNQNTHEPSVETNTSSELNASGDSLFSSGTFVLALIVIGLFVALITWSVSFAGLFFGAVGALLSIASCCLDHDNLRFKPRHSRSFTDENWAYIAMRAVAGAVLGTATTLLAIRDFEQTHWAAISVLAIAGAYVLDTLLFKRR
ncbi:hypothetical protein [Pelistega europaea]|uniref:Uncharacterized protein n=1 Tax=Pelistega europaea TaxID=106147 RepID=A0A7Y4P708_9BURK|nr:hypothetical protein [Pelistega europaea]NOL50265.1 hypothetical protein [Pelistega europaea]